MLQLLYKYFRSFCHYVDVPERLRGCTRNALGSARVSSSLTAVAFSL